MSDCQRRYDLGGGDIMECERHLLGNPFRENEGPVHSAERYGIVWTWRDSEAMDEDRDRLPATER